MNQCKTTSVNIIGLGVAEQAQLSEEALTAFNKANVVLGSKRQIATVQHLLNEQLVMVLPKLSQLQQWMRENEGKDIIVLASGDPLFYGIGQWFAQHYLNDDQYSVCFHPAVSSMQVACHLLGISLQNTDVVSLHGRLVHTIRTALKKHQYCIVLTDQHSQPKILAQECQQAGFEKSTLWVCENLGYKEQQVRKFTVDELLDHDDTFDPLHITVIYSDGRGGVVPEFPGIADEHFITDVYVEGNNYRSLGKGLLSKREVRLNILSLLQPQAKDIAWDVGAGCGGVSVEWALWNKRGEVYAIEHHEKRLACLHANQQKFGVSLNLNIIEGRAPEVLSELPDPTVIFIGGSDGELADILPYCWERLCTGGRLVASAVTENTKHELHSFLNAHPYCESQSNQISISRAEQLAGQLLYRPVLPVTLIKMIKCPEVE